MMLWANAINVGMGIVVLYCQHLGYTDYFPVIPRFGIPYLLISVSLNVLLTLMIVIRLILHGGNTRTATGSAAGISGLCKAVSTMLIESCALFAVSSLAVVVALVRARYYKNQDNSSPGLYVLEVLFPILAETQVRAFSRLQYPSQLSNGTMDWTGDRSTTHHPTGRQSEGIDKLHGHHWTRQFVQR